MKNISNAIEDEIHIEIDEHEENGLSDQIEIHKNLVNMKKINKNVVRTEPRFEEINKLNVSNSLFFNSNDVELEGFFKELTEIFAKNNKKLQYSNCSPLISETDMRRTPIKAVNDRKRNPSFKDVNKSQINVIFDETFLSNIGNVNTDTLIELRKKVIDFSKHNKTGIEIGDLCFKLGNVHAQLNDTVGALECYENALKIYVNCENGEVKCAECFKNFSNLYMKYDVESSVNNLDICINLYTKNLGQNCLENADCYFKKGICAQNLEKWAESKECFQKSLEIYMKNINYDESIDVADCYFKLGKVNEKLECFEAALGFYQNSLNIYLKKLGNSHINIGNNYYNIGVVYENLGNYTLAIENYINSNKIFSLISGENSEDYIDTLITIAGMYAKVENNEEAISYFTNALNLCNVNKLKSSKELFKINCDLILVYVKTKNHEKALQHLFTCMTISKNDSEMTIYLYEIWLKFIEKCGKEVSSNILQLVQTYIERLSKLKEDPSYIAEMLFSIGKSFSKCESSAKAIDLLQKAITLYEKSSSYSSKPIQLKLCEIYNLLGIEYDKVKDYDESLDCFNKTLKIRKKTLGPEHLKTAGAYNNVAIAYDKLNKFVDALEAWKYCMEIRLKKLPQNDIKIANSFYNLSIILFKMKDYEESVKYMLKSIEIYNEKLGEDNIFSADAAMNLGELFRIVNNYVSAESFLENAVRIYAKKLENYQTNPVFLKTSCLLACTYSENKKHEIAINTILPILREVKSVLGENSLTTIDTMFELGVCYNETNDLESAYRIFNEINKNVIKSKWPENKIKLLNKRLFQVSKTIESRRYKGRID